jgi:hypothetical protein
VGKIWKEAAIPGVIEENHERFGQSGTVFGLGFGLMASRIRNRSVDRYETTMDHSGDELTVEWSIVVLSGV